MELLIIALLVILIVRCIGRPAAEAAPGWSKAHAETDAFRAGEVLIILLMIGFAVVFLAAALAVAA